MTQFCWVRSFIAERLCPQIHVLIKLPQNAYERANWPVVQSHEISDAEALLPVATLAAKYPLRVPDPPAAPVAPAQALEAVAEGEEAA